MIVNFLGQSFDCQSAKKSNNTAILTLSDGGAVKFSGVSDFSQFVFENGGWDLHEIKSERIAQSKADLQSYLETHPVLWTDGKYYSITSEKQQWLTSKLFSATMAKQSGQEYSLTWNDTEEVCTAWDLDELWKLARYIEKRVTDLVTYQQTQEVSMRNADTQESLDAIVVDYDSVVTPDV